MASAVCGQLSHPHQHARPHPQYQHHLHIMRNSVDTSPAAGNSSIPVNATGADVPAPPTQTSPVDSILQITQLSALLLACIGNEKVALVGQCIGSITQLLQERQAGQLEISHCAQSGPLCRLQVQPCTLLDATAALDAQHSSLPVRQLLAGLPASAARPAMASPAPRPADKPAAHVEQACRLLLRLLQAVDVPLEQLARVAMGDGAALNLATAIELLRAALRIAAHLSAGSRYELDNGLPQPAAAKAADADSAAPGADDMATQWWVGARSGLRVPVTAGVVPLAGPPASDYGTASPALEPASIASSTPHDSPAGFSEHGAARKPASAGPADDDVVAIVRLIGELAHILRPAVYMLCIRRWGRSAWQTAVVPMACEALAQGTSAWAAHATGAGRTPGAISLWQAVFAQGVFAAGQIRPSHVPAAGPFAPVLGPVRNVQARIAALGTRLAAYAALSVTGGKDQNSGLSAKEQTELARRRMALLWLCIRAPVWDAAFSPACAALDSSVRGVPGMQHAVGLFTGLARYFAGTYVHAAGAR